VTLPGFANEARRKKNIATETPKVAPILLLKLNLIGEKKKQIKKLKHNEFKIIMIILLIIDQFYYY